VEYGTIRRCRKAFLFLKIHFPVGEKDLGGKKFVRKIPNYGPEKI